MKHLALILSFTLFSVGFAVAQISAISEIDEKVGLIRNNESYRKEVFNASEVYDIAFDGGGIIKLSLHGDTVKIISQEIGMKWTPSLGQH